MIAIGLSSFQVQSCGPTVGIRCIQPPDVFQLTSVVKCHATLSVMLTKYFKSFKI